jgi:NAD(P)-dependent dehydrogenase (short-subunit alcohol dehydrogenase family)
MRSHLLRSHPAKRAFRTWLIGAVTLGAVAAAAQPAAAQTPRADTLDMTGRVALVTGSTDGLGREVARALAARGAHVIVHGRNVERGRELVQEITAQRVGSARFFAVDFASLAAVRALADSVLKHYPRVHLLVNNAGIRLADRTARQTSAEGYELHFAVNYLAGYLLTELLLTRLRESAPSRILFVASRTQQPIDFANVMLDGNYTSGRGYAQSKLAQIIYAQDLAEQLKRSNIVVYAVHPAGVMNTNMMRSIGATPRSTVEQGLASTMQAITTTSAPTGTYFFESTIAAPNAQAADTSARRRLRELSKSLTGTP